jgi:spermidine/putrescine transport system permease protein
MTNRRAFGVWRCLGWLFVAAVLLAMYAPVAMIFIYSFNESRIGSVWGGFSTKWYPELARESDLWRALRASCSLGVATAILSTLLGTMAALGLSKWRLRPRRAATGVLALPLVIPDVMLAVSLALAFKAIGLPPTFVSVVLGHTVFGIAYAYVVMAGAVGDLDRSLFDAALDAGATPWQAFWRVTAPLLAPSLAVAALLVFALSFDDFLITFMTKGPGMDTLPIEIYSRMRFGLKPSLNAMFVVLFLVTLAGAALAGTLQRLRPAAH